MTPEKKKEIIVQLTSINSELDCIEQEITKLINNLDEKEIQDNPDSLQAGVEELKRLLLKVELLNYKLDDLEKELK